MCCCCCQHMDVFSRYCYEKKEFIPTNVNSGGETWCDGKHYKLADSLKKLSNSEPVETGGKDEW